MGVGSELFDDEVLLLFARSEEVGAPRPVLYVVENGVVSRGGVALFELGLVDSGLGGGVAISATCGEVVAGVARGEIVF